MKVPDTPRPHISRRLRYAIDIACKARGDADSVRMALIAEAESLDYCYQLDLAEHFELVYSTYKQSNGN